MKCPLFCYIICLVSWAAYKGPRQGLCHHVTVPLVPTQVSPLDLHNIQLQKETVLSQVAVVEISRKKASRLKRWDEVG